MNLMRKGMKNLRLRKFEGVKDGVGGIAYGVQNAEAIEKMFRGKIQPVMAKSEFSIAGYVYSAEFVLLTNEGSGVFDTLDEIFDGERSFVVLGVKEYEDHTECTLEMKKGKGAMAGG